MTSRPVAIFLASIRHVLHNSYSSSQRLAKGSSSCAELVGMMPRPIVSNSITLNSSSKFLMRLETAGWVINNYSAAKEILLVRITATNVAKFTVFTKFKSYLLTIMCT